MASKPSDTLFNGLPVIDVRSPGEFKHGRAPGAQSLPLFDDEERKRVGIAYKQEGRDEAVLIGLTIVGPKMEGIVKEARDRFPDKEVNMYCWRGGMRSESMAWLLSTSGYKVNLISGGYKAWRGEVMDILGKPYRFINIGGLTGVGKTDVLVELSNLGEQVINLEALASHTGSAFNPYEIDQPSTEQFENVLAEHLLHLDPEKPIWIEDESRSIGKIFLNEEFFKSKQAAPFVLISRTKEERVKQLCTLYGTVPAEDLKASFEKIKKRIGGQYLNAAVEYIDEGNLPAAARIALRYYDKAYMYGMEKNDRKPIFSISLAGKSDADAAKELIQWRKKTPNLFD